MSLIQALRAQYPQYSQYSDEEITSFLNPQALARPAAPGAPAEPESGGTFDAIGGGFQTLWANTKATWNTAIGDNEDVVANAQEADAATTTADQRAFRQALATRIEESDEGILDGIANVASAIYENPTGAFHELSAQLPNAGAVMGGMIAGGAAGTAILPGIGTIVGGIVGMFGGNAAIEIGSKANERARDGVFTDQERGEALSEGAIKAGVLTGVDALTMGSSKLILGAPGRAVEQAVSRTLVDSGVDIANKAAVEAAMKNPAIARKVVEAGGKAFQQSTTRGQNIGRGLVAFGNETLGEGVGEYVGELAATGEASATEAVLESLMAVPLSAGELHVANRLNTEGTNTGLLQRGLDVDLRKQESIDSALARIDQAGRKVAAEGGDSLDQARAKSEASADELPGAVSEIDQLIKTANGQGFREEADRLSRARMYFQQAEQVRAAGDNARGAELAAKGNAIVRDIMGDPGAESRTRDQFPVPYSFQGEVEGGELAPVDPSRGPGAIDGETIDQPARAGRDPRPGLGFNPSQRLTDQGIIYGQEPGDARAAREQRQADHFSALYGQEGRDPGVAPDRVQGEYVPRGRIVERDRLLESQHRPAARLPHSPAQQLPPGTEQINMGRDRPERTFTPVPGEYEGVGRNVVERQAQRAPGLPRGNAARTISQQQMAEIQQRYRQAIRVPMRHRTEAHHQAVEQHQALQQAIKAGDVVVDTGGRYSPRGGDLAPAQGVDMALPGKVTDNRAPNSETLQQPMRVYHGTAAGNDFDRFDDSRANSGVGANARDQGNQRYATTSERAARWFSGKAEQNRQLMSGAMPDPDVKGDVLAFDLAAGSRVLRVEDMPRGKHSNASAMIEQARKQGYDAIQFPDRGFDTIEGDPEVFNMLNEDGTPDTVIVLNDKALMRVREAAVPKPAADHKASVDAPQTPFTPMKTGLKIERTVHDIEDRLQANGVKYAKRKDGSVVVSNKFADQARQAIPIKVEQVEGIQLETYEDGRLVGDDGLGSVEYGTDREDVLRRHWERMSRQAEQKTKAAAMAKQRYHRDPDPTKDDLLTAITLAGGINRDHAEGVDPADFKRRVGIKYVFPKNGGMSLDEAAEYLEQFGYLNGADRMSELQAKLDNALRGEEVLTPEAQIARLEQMDYDDLEFEVASDWDELNAQLVSDVAPGGPAPESDVLASWVQKAQDAGVSQIEIDDIIDWVAPESEAIAQLQEKIDAKTRQGSRGRDGASGVAPQARPEENAGTAGQGYGAGAPESDSESEGSFLTSYTEADLQARDAEQQAERDRQARLDAEAERKAQADAELSDFRLSGSNAAADIAAAGGQNSLFGAGGQPAATESTSHGQGVFDSLVSQAKKRNVVGDAERLTHSETITRFQRDQLERYLAEQGYKRELAGAGISSGTVSTWAGKNGDRSVTIKFDGDLASIEIARPADPAAALESSSGFAPGGWAWDGELSQEQVERVRQEITRLGKENPDLATLADAIERQDKSGESYPERMMRALGLPEDSRRNVVRKAVTKAVEPAEAETLFQRGQVNDPAKPTPRLKEGVSADILERLENTAIDAEDRVERLKQRLDDAAKQAADLPGWSVTGRDGRSKSLDKRINAATDKQMAIFRELQEAEKEAARARRRVEGYRAGLLHENGQPKSQKAAEAKVNLSYSDYIKQKVKPGDQLWFLPNPGARTIKRLNKNTVTIEGGTKWEYLDFAPMVDGREMSQAEIKADMQRLQEGDRGEASFEEVLQATYPADENLRDLSAYGKRLAMEAVGAGRYKTEMRRAIEKGDKAELVRAIRELERTDRESKGLVPARRDFGEVRGERQYSDGQVQRLFFEAQKQNTTQARRYLAQLSKYQDRVRSMPELDAKQFEVDYLELLLQSDEVLARQVKERPWLATVLDDLAAVKRELREHKEKHTADRRKVYEGTLSQDAAFDEGEFKSWTQAHLASFKAIGGKKYDYLLPSQEAEFTEHTERASRTTVADKAAVKDWTKATFLEYMDGLRAMLRGEMDFAEYQAISGAVTDRRHQIRAEISGMTKPKILESMGMWFQMQHKGDKKDRLVDAALRSLLASFHIGPGLSFGMSELRDPDAYVNRYAEAIRGTTEEQFVTWREKQIEGNREQQARLDQRKKALTEPETLAEFKEFIQLRGLGKLSDEQRARYDALVAEQQMAEKPKVRAGLETDERVELGEPEEGTHGKTGETIFNVKVITRLGKDKFKEAAAFARSLKGGYYRGNFYFKSREDAELFSGWVNGESVDLSEQQQARTEAKREQAAGRLKAMADRLESQGQAELNRERQENTGRRMSMAESARNAAAADVRTANILRAVADSDTRFLGNLSQKVQVETLDKLVRQLKYNAPDSMRETDRNGNVQFKAEVSPEARVKYARLPLTQMHVGTARDLANAMIGQKGYIQYGRRILAGAKGLQDNARVEISGKTLDAAIRYIDTHSDKYSPLKGLAADYKRLQRMGINSPEALRAALLEYMAIADQADTGTPKQSRLDTLQRDLQRTLVGNRNAFNDFFPTPEATATEIVELANIEPGMKVLEPSAGNGLLADAAKTAGAEVDAVELAGPLREILQEKGHNLVGDDFTEFAPGEQYDRIVMNPPFSNDQDIQHVAHAYTMLKPGGRLVAIVSATAGDRQNKRNQAYRAWLDELGAEEQALPEGAFKSSLNPTAVRTKAVVIDKPSEGAPEVPALFSRGSGSVAPLGKVKLSAVVDRIAAGLKGARRVVIVDNVAELFELAPAVQRDAERQGSDGSDVEGVFHKGTVYLVADKISSEAQAEALLFHEATHGGVNAMFKDEGVSRAMNRLFAAMGGSAGFNRIVDQMGIRDKLKPYIKGTLEKDKAGNPKFSREQRNLVLVHEMLAFIGEQGSRTLKLRAQEVVGAIRAWLRNHGFAKLAEYGATDIAYLAKSARQDTLSGRTETRFATAGAMLSRAGRSGSDRAAWGDFPEVVFQAKLGAIKDHPQYRAAKGGDEDAAAEVVRSVLNDEALASIRRTLGDRKPIVVPVLAQEASGANKLPLAYAHALAQRLGLTVGDDIIQSVRAKHTDAGAFHRIGIQPAFDGQVEPGQDYIVVDDTMTMGGTLANLRGHIEANGGNVVLASTLTGFPTAANIAITEKMKNRLLAKHGDALNDYLQSEFGFGIDALTQGEAGHLRAAPSLDEIRARIAAARDEAGFSSTRQDDVLDDDTTLFRRQATADQFDDLTEQQASLLNKIGPVSAAESLKARASKLLDNWRLKVRQQIVDRYAPLFALDQKARGKDVIEDSIQDSSWVLARMASSAEGAVSAMLNYGRLKYEDGVIDIQEDTKGLIDTLKQLGDSAEIERFMGWIAANRAQKLAEQGRENLFEPDEIAEGVKLNQGRTKDGKDRGELYAQVFDEFQAIRDDVLAIADQAGLLKKGMEEDEAILHLAQQHKIRPDLVKKVKAAARAMVRAEDADEMDDAAGRHGKYLYELQDAVADAIEDFDAQLDYLMTDQRELWANEFYVPFYRVMEDEEVKGPGVGGGLSRQQAYKKLKGGSNPLADLLGNTIMNFNHLVGASLKNVAAAKALENAEVIGAAALVSEHKRDKKASTFVLRNGIKHWYNVDDPLVYRALITMSDSAIKFPGMNLMRGFKRVFTNFTTSSPQFILANLIRDTLQAAATSEVSANVGKNVLQGMKSYGVLDKNSRTRAKMLASGGAFSFGHIYGDDPEYIKAKIDGELRKASVIKDPAHALKFLQRVWDKYHDVSDSFENVNRAALYEQNQDKGKLYAAFKSRDLMDFSQRGMNPVVTFLIDTVPFLNARIQGLDKLYRSGAKPIASVLAGKGTDADKQAAKRFAAVTGALTLATIALYLANRDDDDYRELEDWQKDSYWFIKVGPGDAVFIPKPFEVGAIATLAERMVEQMVDDQAEPELFLERLGHMLSDTFSFNPVPQVFRPMLDVKANTDSFTDRPIESVGMDRLSPSLRQRSSTTDPAKWVSAATENTFGAWFGSDSMLVASPVQVDYLVGNYFGWLGERAMAIIDTVSKQAQGKEEPHKEWSEYQPVRRFYRDLSKPGYTKYQTEFYEDLREVNRVYADIQELRELGRQEEAMDLARDNQDTLRYRKMLNRVQRQLSALSQRAQMIRRSNLSAEEKRRRLDLLQLKKNRLTEMVEQRMAG